MSDVTMLCCNRPHSQCECLMICDDCGEEFPGKLMSDTIAGVLCPGCADRFLRAAQGLAYVQRKGEVRHG